MKTIKQNTLFDLVNKKTKPTISTDKDIAFVKSVIPIVDEKEDLGITDSNLILAGVSFPTEPNTGQMFRKDNKLYVYKEDTNDS
jgi:hypothetical protein